MIFFNRSVMSFSLLQQETRYFQEKSTVDNIIDMRKINKTIANLCVPPIITDGRMDKGGTSMHVMIRFSGLWAI